MTFTAQAGRLLETPGEPTVEAEARALINAMLVLGEAQGIVAGG